MRNAHLAAPALEDQVHPLVHLQPWQRQILREIDRARRGGYQVQFVFPRRTGLSTLRQFLESMPPVLDEQAQVPEKVWNETTPRSPLPAARSPHRHAR